jgi:hypothetical protein
MRKGNTRGQFWISPPRYARFRIVFQDNHAISRAPVVKITSKGLIVWAGRIFVEFGSWVVAGSKKQMGQNRHVGKIFVTRPI